MSFQNIPAELQALNQWCCWRYEDIGAKKPTKVPYHPSGIHMNVNEPSTWCSFNEAISKAVNYDGIGFVFSADDPFTFIDLDDCSKLLDNTPNPNYQIDLKRQIDIFKECNSYSEISPSGKGLHVIVRGSVARGRKRAFVEVYSSQRYATFTGNIYHNVPIVECQNILTQLWEQMGSGPVATNLYKGNDIEKHTDLEIIEQAKNAVNGDKFQRLFYGDWSTDYGSQTQSEADMALVNIISFYTQNEKQIARIFRSSGLGKRPKANRSDYMHYMILKSFDRILPPIDFDGFKNALEAKLAEPQLALNIPVPERSKPTPYSLPPGLVGEIAQFIYQAAPLPVPEIALAGAIGFMAGICGRAYNVNGEGLNQYILLIAQSGTGKEAMASGIDKLMNTIKLQVPTSTRIIGPGEITSGEALIKYINNTSQCFVSVLSEFGYRLQRLTDKRDAAQGTLKRMLLDLYHKSGNGRVFKPKIFSDKDKNIGETLSPAFSILAETTPSTLYEHLTEEMISDGLLPRFSLIEYKGERVALNEDCASVQPPNWLVEKLASFVAACETLNYNKKVVNIQITNEAQEELRKFGKYATAIINKNDKEDIRQLWNRAHIKAWKLAGTLAVGINMIDPVITLENVTWALNMVHNDITALSQKFESGEIGTNNLEDKQNSDLIRMIKDFYSIEKDIVVKYKVNKILYDNKVIPYQYLSVRLLQMASYKNDRIGSTNALKRAIQSLLDMDKIREVSKKELAERFGTTQRSFVVVDISMVS